MSCSLVRWVAAFALAVGVICPASSPAQTKLSLSDTDTYSAASYYDQAGEDPAESSPSDPAKPSVEAEHDFATCCDDSCDTCCVARNWVSADYLMWWTKGNRLPAIITTSPAGTPQAAAGVMGAAGTTVLFGNGDIDDEERNGMRFTFGHWADPDGTVGIQATYFGVFDDTSTGDFSARTNGVIGGCRAPILARPFFNMDPLINAEDSRLISFPGVVDGSTNINSSSEMHSMSVLLRQHWRSGNRGRIDLLGGYRYFKLRDGLIVSESLVTTDPAGAFPLGTTFTFEDRFRTENHFHGGDLGFIAEFWDEGWSLEFLAKVAVGNLRREVTVGGSAVTDTPPPGAGVATNGGLLALPTNSGTRTANDFAALPEFGVNLKFEPRRNVTMQAGYTLLMLTDVARTGEMIDRSVNATQLLGGALVGPARPATLIDNQTDFWAHGVNFGVTFTR